MTFWTKRKSRRWGYSMTDMLDIMDPVATDDMTLEELRWRLLSYFRTGRVNLDLKGAVLGFAASCKRGHVSAKQLELARGLVRECRYLDGTEPECLIDDDDTDERQTLRDSRDEMWDAF